MQTALTRFKYTSGSLAGTTSEAAIDLKNTERIEAWVKSANVNYAQGNVGSVIIAYTDALPGRLTGKQMAEAEKAGRWVWHDVTD